MHDTKHVLHPLVTGALLLALVPTANAAEQGDRTPESMTVTGYVKQNREEIRAKRNTAQVADFISSDEMGQQPDLNVADSLRRLPDVTTEFDEDEGRFVSIRGLPSRYTTSLFDGAIIPDGWFALGRQTDLESIPGIALKRVAVYKSLTPDLQPAIGGVVDLQPISAFDFKDFQAVTDTKIGHYSDQATPGGPTGPAYIVNGRINDQFGADHQFGYVLAGSFSDRARDQQKDLRTFSFDDAGNPLLRRRDQADYNNRLERSSVLGRLEYRPSDSLYSSLLGAHYSYDSNEYRYLNILEGRNLRSANASGGSYAQGRDRYRLDYFPEQTRSDLAIWDLEFKPADKQRLSSKLYAARGTYERQMDGQFEFRSAYSSRFGYQYDLTTQDAADRQLADVTLNNPGELNNSANFSLYNLQPEHQQRQQTVKEWRGDYGFNFDRHDRGLGAQVGLGWRRTEVEQDIDQQTLTPTSARVLPASPIGDYADYYKAVNAFVASNPRLFKDNAATDALLSTQDDLDYTEDVGFGFGTLRYRGERFEVLGGVRYEHTRFDASAYQNLGGVLQPSGNAGRYDNLLPSLSAYYDLTDRLRLRAGFSQALGRPNPSYVVPQDSTTLQDGQVNITRGNPGLKPITSNNYDLALDYYFGRGALASVAVFQKDLQNEIFVGKTSDLAADGTLVVTS